MKHTVLQTVAMWTTAGPAGASGTGESAAMCGLSPLLSGIAYIPMVI